MTADRLARAATTLRALADEALRVDAVVWYTPGDLTMDSVPDADARLIAALGPDFARAVADLLDAEAGTRLADLVLGDDR